MSIADDEVYTEQLSEVREVQTDLVKQLLQLCKKHEIEIFAVYGTLLGTIRHSGYIPWDDDVDLAIWREDIDALKEAVQEIGSDYCLITDEDENDYYCNVMKFQNNNTTCINFDCFSSGGSYGIWIDIEIIDSTFSSSILRFCKNWLLDCLFECMLKKQYKTCALYFAERKKTVRKVLNCLFSKLSRKQLQQLLNWLYPIHGLSSCYCSIYYYHQYPFLEKKWFQSAKMESFEKLLMPIPSENCKCLERFYGAGYMELPLEEERKPKHLINMFIDADTPYSVTLQHIWNFANVEEGKHLVLWGAGNMCDHYLRNFGEVHRPEWIIDNNSDKWGTEKAKCPIVGPDILQQYEPEKIHLVICNIYYAEIVSQVKKMGNYDYYIYLERYVDAHIHEGIGGVR